MLEIQSLAHDISSALFRVSRIVHHKKIRSELEGAAIDLVRDLSIDSINTLTRLVELAEAVGEMNSVNADVILREAGNLLDIMTRNESLISEKEDSVYLGDIFGNGSDLYDTHNSFGNDDIAVSSGNDSINASVKERQAEIVEFIRQFPNTCRMRDLNEKFSDVSERTLRNDIQTLIEEGLVERLGGRSGPNSYFEVIDTSKYSVDEDNGSLNGAILLPEAGERMK